MKVQIYSDGGSRGNPGQAAIGFVIKESGNTVLSYGEPIGVTTNNVAEYKAALKAIRMSVERGFRDIELFVDSQLVERQVNGVYKVKSEELLLLHSELKQLIATLHRFSIRHIPRELNKEADKLVNAALDNEKIIFLDHFEELDGKADEESQLMQILSDIRSIYNETEFQDGVLTIRILIEESGFLNPSMKEKLKKVYSLGAQKIFIEIKEH